MASTHTCTVHTERYRRPVSRRAVFVEEVGRRVHLRVQVVHAAVAAEATAANEHAPVRHQHCAAVVRAGHRGRCVQCEGLRGGVPDLCRGKFDVFKYISNSNSNSISRRKTFPSHTNYTFSCASHVHIL